MSEVSAKVRGMTMRCFWRLIFPPAPDELPSSAKDDVGAGEKCPDFCAVKVTGNCRTKSRAVTSAS